MLDKFIADVGEERLDVPEDRGLTFYQVLTLASIVEREAILDEERPLIAGVYQNRIDGLKGVKNKILNADPTVIYAIDTMELDELRLRGLAGVLLLERRRASRSPTSQVPRSSQGYQTYQTPGLIPGPIATPSLASIDAALEPDTSRQLHVLRGDPGRRRRARVREDARGARREPAASTATCECAAGRAGPARTSPPPPTRRGRRALGRGRSRGAPGPPRRGSAHAFADDGRRRLLRRPPRAHALPDRASPSTRARRRSPATPASSWSAATRSSSSPTRATRSRRAARRPRPASSRPTATCRRAGRTSLASVGARRVAVEAGFVPHAHVGAPARGGPGRRARARRGLGRGRPRDQGAGRARADRRGLRRRRPGPRGAAARDPAGRHRGGPRAAPRVADADRRRRGARVRRRLPGRAGGGAAARLAGRPAGRSTARSCCSTSGPRSRATAAT